MVVPAPSCAVIWRDIQNSLTGTDEVSSAAQYPAPMPEAARPPHRADPRVLAAVALLTIIGAVLRFEVAQEPLFADELSSYWIVTDHGFGGVFSTVHSNAEITPPLFFALSWVTGQVSHAPEVIRAPSLIAGVLTIPLMYALGERTVGRFGAVLAAALAAVAPFMVYYSAEARAYALMTAFVVLSTLAMLVATDRGSRRWWAVYAAASCASVYSHYTAVFALAIQLAWLLWAHPAARRPAFAANAAAVVGFLPWITGLRNDLNSPTSEILSSLSPLGLKDIAVAFEHWAIGYPYDIVPLPQLPGTAALVALAAATAVSVGAVILRSGVGRWPRRAGWARDDRRVLVVLLAVGVPVGELVVSAVSTNLFGVRNMAPGWPGLALTMTALVVASGPRLRYLTGAATLAVFLTGALMMLEHQNQRPDQQASADYVERQIRPGDVIVDATGALSGALSPGPLTTLDTTLRPGIPVFRAGTPAERDHPFGLRDPVGSFADAFSAAAAAAKGSTIFVVRVDFSGIAKGRQENERQRALTTARRNGRYHLARTETFAGFLPAQVQVFERRH